MILRHTFSPPDNARMGHLCGPMDAHIRTIEAACQVKIAHRFEQFRIEGPKAKATQALETLQALYEMARRPIPAEQVQLMLSGDTAMPAVGDEALAMQTRRGEVRGRTPNQARYLENMATHDITFGIGPAGTGKTYLAVACAVDALERSAVQRIVLTRPAVEAGERLGFLPGDLTQKVDPYLRPLYDALYDLMGYDKVQKAFERQQIEIAPLAFMRGRTLNHAFVILDEAQNTTVEQMKMFLTRIGFGSKAVVTGDVSQIDLPRTQLSGLIDAERVLKRVQGIAINRLTSADVVRHPLVARIVDAYDARQTPSDLDAPAAAPARKRRAVWAAAMPHPIALLLAALASGLAGCAHALPAASSSRVEAPGWTGQTVNYRCTDGRRLAVVYLNPQQGDALAVLATDGVQAVLRSLPSASGARYADTDEQRGLRWHTQGDTGRLALMPADHTGSERTLSANCRAQP